MSRYIDVDGYRKLFDEEFKKTRKLISEGETHLDNLAEGFTEAGRVIDRIPAADVVEVRHGYWDIRFSKHIDHLGEFFKYEGDFCSICGAMGYGKYCYECGAKMDGERRDDGT